MQFQRLTSAQIDLLAPHFSRFTSRTCDYTVGGMFMWRDYYRMEYAVSDGAVFTRLTDESGRHYYNLPMSSDMNAALAHLKREVLSQGSTVLRFCTVPEQYVSTVAKLFAAPFVTVQEDFSDYLYAADDLVGLKGRKYSAQRNLISQFCRAVSDWSFEIIDSRNISDVREFFRAYCSFSGDGSAYADEENRMVWDVLEHPDAYHFCGGMLKAAGAVVGFSLGEQVNDTLFTHIEKADRRINGTYQMLVNQFARTFADGKAAFINREEDMGDPGLRRAKEAYHPVCKLTKYVVEGELL